MRTNQRKGRKAGVPYVGKPILKLNNQAWKIAGEFAELTVAPRKTIKIKLASYVMKMVDGANLGSVTVTPNKMILSYSKTIQDKIPDGCIGIDMNFNNVTTCDTNGNITRLDMSKVGKIKQKCRETVSHSKRNDHRIRKKIEGKYGRLGRNRTQYILHKTSKKIVNMGHIPNMEDLEGISKKWDKKNKRGRNANFRGKNWGYGKLQRQMGYKAEGKGYKAITVNPWGTSSKCAACGGKMITEERRMMRCPRGNVTIDPDENASINILARGLKDRPVGSASEAMIRCERGRTSLMVQPLRRCGSVDESAHGG